MRNVLCGWFLIAVSLLCGSSITWAKSWQVQSAEELKDICKQVQAGDEIIWADGSYADEDVQFIPQNKGEMDKPITLRAQTPGKVILTGSSRLLIRGTCLVVSGFDLNGGSIPSDWVIRFDVGSQHCRLTQTRIHDKNGDGHKSKWVYIHGINHEIDHCTFTNKTVEDNLLTVWLDDVDPEKGANHHIHDNYFANRPKGTDSNGWEIMRIGDSKTSLQAGRVKVERNLFEHCDGEIEIISNKSCFNAYLNNTFIDCKGQLTLRHGNNCVVRDNVFLGSGHELNSGIRIIGQGHHVEGNHLEKLNGEQFYGAIVMCNGVQNGALHTYGPVRDCIVRNNLIIACRSPFDIGVHTQSGDANVAPTDSLFENNTIIDPGGKALIQFRTTQQGTITWQNNRVTGMDMDQKLILDNESPLPENAFELLKESPAKVREASLQRLKPLDRLDVGVAWAR